MTTGDWVQVAVAIGTSALAVVTAAGYWLEHRRFVIAVRPILTPEGDRMFMEHEAPTAPEGTTIPGAGRTLLVRNTGGAEARHIQWEIGLAVGYTDRTRVVARPATYLLRLGVNEAAPLWHVSGTGRPQPMDGFRLTLWYDDMLGHQYRAAYELQGTRWVETGPGRLRSRLWRRIGTGDGGR